MDKNSPRIPHGEGKATIKVTLTNPKRKTNNTKKLSCVVKVKAASQNEAAFSASAAASSTTSVKVTFTKAVDADSVTKDSFKVSDENVSVTDAALSADGLSADLTINGAVYGKTYEMTISGAKVAGAAQADLKVSFKTPEATDAYQMELTAADSILKSNGATTTNVKFTIKDKDGKVLTDKVEVKFEASIGSFAEERVTVKADGTAENMYTSETLKQTQTATIKATIVESNNKELYGLEKVTSIVLTPNPEAFDTSLGAVLISAEAETADRVIAYFDKEVHAKDFQTAAGYVDDTKFEATVESGLDNSFTKGSGTETKVVGVLDVAGEKALELLVENPMKDNSNVRVTFNDKRNKDSVVSGGAEAKFKLTDTRQPSVLSVVNDGQQKIVVEFSEAVLPRNKADASTEKFAADKAQNYLIDGYPANSGVWNVTDGDSDSTRGVDLETTKDDERLISKKFDNEDASDDAAKVKVGTFKKGEDSRYKVTISLGKKTLQAGQHTLQIANVGDWAAKTDYERNIVNTQTFSFTVEDNSEAPTFTVDEQSPEQWLLTFNCDVKLNKTGTNLVTRDSSGSTKSVLELQVKDGSEWKTISDDAGTDAGNKKNPIRVSRVKDMENGEWTNQYVVEVRRDWTEVYNTKSTKDDYYRHDFRLHIAKEALYNAANGKKNDDINKELNGSVMTNPDNDSPVIKDIVQVVDDKTGKYTEDYNVTMSEPVKLSVGANLETLTKSQTQIAGVPTPLAQFIKTDTKETVDGIIKEDTFIDAYDTTFRVSPAGTLSEGEWTLVVRSISDDIGNTASTNTGVINVKKDEAKTGFEIVWAAVSKTKEYGKITDDEGITDDWGSYIFVKFNKAVSVTADSTGIYPTSNYTIDGRTLPTGAYILAGIEGYDREQNLNRGVTDSITIVLPDNLNSTGQGVWKVNGKDSVLNISKTITAAGSTDTLSNGGEIKLPFQIGNSDGTHFMNGSNNAISVTADDTWGNADEEQYKGQGANKGYTDKKEYYKALVNALNSNKYRRVILTENCNIDLTDKNQSDGTGVLNIGRAVDEIDLNGNTITGNVVVSTSDATASMMIKSSKPGAQIIGKANNKKGDCTLTVDADNILEFYNDTDVTIKVKANNNSCTGDDVQEFAANVNGVYHNTFVNKGEIKGIKITDSTGSGLDNVGTISGNIEIAAAAAVNLKGTYDSTHLTGTNGIVVTGKATINIGTEGYVDLSNAKINVKADTTVNVSNSVNNDKLPTIIADNAKVTIGGSGKSSITTAKCKYSGSGVVEMKDPDTNETVKISGDGVPEAQGTDAQEAINKIAKAVSDAAITVDAGRAANAIAGTSDDTNSVRAAIKNAISTNSLSEIITSDNVKISVPSENAWFKVDKPNGNVVMKKANDVTTDKTVEVTITFEDTTSNAKKALKVAIILKAPEA